MDTDSLLQESKTLILSFYLKLSVFLCRIFNSNVFAIVCISIASSIIDLSKNIIYFYKNINTKNILIMHRFLKLIVLFFFIGITSINAQVNTSYLWHLQQPIYWPEVSQDGYHYQAVKQSQDIKDGGGNQYGTGVSHPTNNLYEIFSKDDRKNVYQHVPKNSVQQLLGYADAGAQVNYSGCLIENTNSLADAGQWGYYSGWEQNFVDARGWQTSDGFPRLDIVGFTFHHALSPLISERAFRMELQAHKHIYGNTFGSSPNYTKGYWPAECCFSERNIQVLVEEGFEWSIIANSHLSRTLNDYPLHYGTNGCNISPPNQADVVSTNGINWWNGQIDGRGGEFAAPYCYQAHKAQYIDPATGTQYLMDVVPMADLLSYRDGYSAQGTGDIDANIVPYNDPSHNSIVLFAHDGDNAWGGGSSYYFEAVPNFVSAANSNTNLHPSTIQQFLYDNPVPADDIVHVEDGGWVNAANDWGHPQFINWLWPLYDNSTYEFDPDAWTEDARNWAVITAIDNYACMAEDLDGAVDINDVVYPSASSTNAEKAWHFYLPSLTSGYMYYGNAEDMEVKQTIAGNNAIAHAQNSINANPGVDNTPPSVFIPQRFPYNPGGREFGPIYGYQEHISSKDFTVWTYAYDVNGITSAVLKYRTDYDGVNTIDNYDNDTYAGGATVTDWQSISMTKKVLDASYNPGDPNIDFFVLPTAIANLYHAEISGLSDTLVDYYVEVTDTDGNVFKTAIQHVYVGNENGGSPSAPYLYWVPENPTKNDVITIVDSQATAISKLHWGVVVDGAEWTEPISAYWPAGSGVNQGALQTPFTDPDNDGVFTVEIGPLNDPSQVVEQVCFVVKLDDNTWDNNNGSDYFIDVINDVSDNPTGANETITIMMNDSYSFETDDFTFNGVGGATFAGIKIISVETDGDLEYDGSDVTASQLCSDVSLLQFIPATDEIGMPYATFTFKVVDSEARESDTDYTFSINVTNDNPIGANMSVTMNQDDIYTFEVDDFPFTGTGGATFAGVQIISLETEGSLQYNGSDVTSNQTCSDVTLLSYSPAAGENGNPYDNFGFKVVDSEGRYSDYDYSCSIIVNSLNPTSASSSVSLMQDAEYTFEIANFPFFGANGTTFAGIQLVSDVDAGYLLYDGGAVTSGVDYSDVTLLTFTPDAGQFGSPYTTFEFKVIDNEGRYSEYSYVLTINVLEDSQPAGVSWFPENPTSNDIITIFVSNDADMTTSSLLHWAVNDWVTPDNSYWPTGTTLFDGTGPSVETPFIQQTSELYVIQVGPFNNPAQIVNEVNFVLHYGTDSWNNNGDANWNIPITQVNTIETADEHIVNVYPNPITSSATVDLTQESGAFEVSLINFNGQVITQSNVIAPLKFNITKGDLPTGVYFLRFVNLSENEAFNKTIIIK